MKFVANFEKSRSRILRVTPKGLSSNLRSSLDESYLKSSQTHIHAEYLSSREISDFQVFETLHLEAVEAESKKMYFFFI